MRQTTLHDDLSCCTSTGRMAHVGITPCPLTEMRQTKYSLSGRAKPPWLEAGNHHRIAEEAVESIDPCHPILSSGSPVSEKTLALFFGTEGITCHPPVWREHDPIAQTHAPNLQWSEEMLQ
ncbi:hypothetical protein D3C78_1150480 [compost metagenome]